jgi:peptide/nickel transport system permease protein
MATVEKLNDTSEQSPLQGPSESQKEMSWSRIFWRRFRKNKLAMIGLIMLVALFAVAIFAPVIAPQERDSLILSVRLKPPMTINPETGQRYWLGTDQYGRDVLTRLLHGSRISLTIGFISTAVALTMGLLVGSVAGYYGGWIDSVLMRLVDVLLSIPTLPLLLTVLAFVGNSIWLIMFVIGITSWMGVARLVRGEILSIKQRDFVEAAKAMGAPDMRIIFKHIAPNLFHVLIVNATLRVAGAMLTEAILSYLGIGVQPPIPSWGNMLYEHQNYLRNAPWTNIWPGVAIFVSMLAFYFVGDGLRDALDPRLKD